MGAVFAGFLTAAVLSLANNVLPEAFVLKLGGIIFYVTLPLGMILCPAWWANWRFCWIKRSFLSGGMIYILAGALGEYYELSGGEVGIYRLLLVPVGMLVWPVFGVYFKPFQPLPAPEMPPAAGAVNKPASILLLAFFLPAFALLGGFTMLSLVLLARSIFAGNFILRLGWLAFCVVCTVYTFRKFGVFRGNNSEPQIPGAIMLVMAWAVFLAGGAVARVNYRSQSNVLENEYISDQNACDEHAKSVLSVHGISESHAPGSGHIVVKATFLARKHLILSGGDWTPNVTGSGPHFYSEVDRTELQPGVPREISIRVVLNPDVPTLPALGFDGPYFIPEIRGYVYDPAITGHWATKSGETSCRTALIRNLTTAAYKAADFTREEWSGYEKKKTASASIADRPKAPGQIKKDAARTKAESDQLIKDAKALLGEAEQELKGAEDSEKRVKSLISSPITVPAGHK